MRHARQSSNSNSRRSKDPRQSYLTTGSATAVSASSSSTHSTIALFGAGSKTATHFLRLALDAGYHVRALLIQQSSSVSDHPIRNAETAALAKALKEQFADQSAQMHLHWVRADSVYDARACQRVLRGADYVVCMMNEAPLTCDADESTESNDRKKKNSIHSTYRCSVPISKDRERDRTSISLCNDCSKPITSFLQVLYPLMKEEASIQVFLYQSTSLAADVKGKTPIFSKVLKTASAMLGAASNILPGHRRSATCLAVEDQDAVVQEISMQHRGPRNAKKALNNDDYDEDHGNDTKENSADDVEHRASFAYIITRPTAFLKDGPSVKKVAASKSQPGPFPIAHVDLAEFSLNALLTKKLYNSCPYVVADSF